jgi:hypothetical protein
MIVFLGIIHLCSKLPKSCLQVCFILLKKVPKHDLAQKHKISGNYDVDCHLNKGKLENEKTSTGILKISDKRLSL